MVPYNLYLYPIGLTGPEGVFCYDIAGTTHMVCGAYSVPYNDLLSDEAFNVKVQYIKKDK